MTAEEYLDAPDAAPVLPDGLTPEQYLDAPELPPGFEHRMVSAGLESKPAAQAGPTVEKAAALDYLDAPVDRPMEWLTKVGPDVKPEAVVKTLEEYDADPSRVLTKQEYAAQQAALSKLPVADRVRRMWEGGARALAAMGDTVMNVSREVPDILLHQSVPQAVPKVLALAGNTVKNFGLQGLGYVGNLGEVQDTPEDFSPEGYKKAALNKSYDSYLLRKGIDVARQEVMDKAAPPGLQDIAFIATDPLNLLPLHVGARGASLTGNLAKRGIAGAGAVVEAPAGAVANAIAQGETGIANRAAAMGITPEVANNLKWAAGTLGAASAAFGASGDENNDWALTAGALLGLPAAMPLTKNVARAVQATGAVARRGAQEALSATGLGVREFAGELAKDTDIPLAYRSQMIAGNPVDSPLRRMAMDEGLPVMGRRLARTLDGTGIAQAGTKLAGLAGSAVDGAVLNALIAQGSSDQDMGGAIATGLLFGGAGRVLHKVSGAERVQLENGDVARMLAEVAADGGNYKLLADLPHDQLAQMAAAQGVFGRNVALRPMGDAEFRAEMANNNAPLDARAVHILEPNGARDGAVLVNVDKLRGDGPHVFAHEYAHALQKSNLMDGAAREEIRSWVDDSFSPEAMNKARVDYAQKVAGTDDVATVARTLADLDRKDVEAGRQVGDWARDEMWAETFAANRGAIDFWGARGRGNGLLRSAARGLQGSGIPIDPATGRVVVESPLFGKIKTQMKGSVLERRLNDYTRAYSRWLNDGVSGGSDSSAGAKVFPDGTPKVNRFVNLAATAPGVRENQFMREVDGRLAFKTQPEIDAEFESRRKTFENMRKGATPQKVEGAWGLHRAPDGSTRVGGSVLPERFHQQPNVGPYLKAVEAELATAQDAGRSVRMVYHKIGSQTSKGYRVKNLGNLKADVMEVIPFWRSISKKDNVLVHVLDADQFRRNVIKEINAGRLPEFNNDMVQVERDLKQYLDNHRQGLPGENGIGARKRDVINNLLGIGTNANKRANPLTLAVGGSRMKSAVKTLRLDRVEIARPGNEGLAFDYNKANNNLMPDGEWRADAAPENPDVRYMPDSRARHEAPLVRVGNGAVTARPGIVDISYLPAYHGTPHKVDKFSLDKIGTGEGAQAYGWGLYFAESKDVAENYRDTLSKKHDKVAVDGRILEDQMSDEAMAIRGYLNYQSGSPKMSFVEWKKETAERMRSAAKYGPGQGNPTRAAELVKAADFIDSLKKPSISNKGNTYTVDLNVKPDELLDWDGPVGPNRAKQINDFVGHWGISVSPDAIGSSVYGAVSRGNPVQGSSILNQIDIPGIRYLDAGSRNRTRWTAKHPQGGENEFVNEADARAFVAKNPEHTLIPPDQTYNYVIFDESKIKILEENGKPVKPSQLSAK
jgi:hypothetical protein